MENHHTNEQLLCVWYFFSVFFYKENKHKNKKI